MRSVPVILLSSLLTLLLGWCLCGHVFWQLRHQWHAREQQKVTANDTLLLSFAEWQDPAVVQQVEEKEIRVRGRMFDIRNVTTLENAVLVTGHYDREDDAYFSFLKAWYSREWPGEGQDARIVWFWPEGFLPGEKARSSDYKNFFVVFYNHCPDPACRYVSLRQEDDPPEGYVPS